MTAWIVAAALGVAVGLVGYAPALRGRAALGWLAATRALATALAAAVALGAPVLGPVRARRLVALDRSASWTRGADARALHAAFDSVDRLASGVRSRVALVGESLRVAPLREAAGTPTDRASRVGGVAESAGVAGLPFVLVTDGEVDDPDALRRAPAGSRVIVLRPRRGPDAALVNLDAPVTVAPGDTATITASVTADSAGSGSGRLGVRLDAGPIIERPIPALGAYGRTTATILLPVPADMRAHAAVLRAFVTSAGDREARNDTAARAVDVTAAPRIVVVSTAPDYDIGLALAVLRGALAAPVRAYYRVAPGMWRIAGTLAPVPEAEVRRAAANAGTLLLHGDTAALGNSRTLTHGALALVPVRDAGDSTADWYAGPAPSPGPLAALAGIAWDSLPPLDLSGETGADAAAALGRVNDRWTGIVARAGRRGAARAVVAGGIDASGRRIAVVSAGGFWRWAFRGGAGAVAAPAVWGALFDWLADAPPSVGRTITLADAFVRSGAPIHWRGVLGGDTLARIRLRHRPSGDPVSLTLRRDTTAGDLRSDSPLPGVYDLDGGGVLVVNASAELLPRRATLHSGFVGAGLGPQSAPTSPIPPAWPLALATLLLCGEWVARRRFGLR